MIVEMRFALQTGIVMDNIPTIFYNTDGSQQRCAGVAVEPRPRGLGFDRTGTGNGYLSL